MHFVKSDQFDNLFSHKLIFQTYTDQYGKKSTMFAPLIGKTRKTDTLSGLTKDNGIIKDIIAGGYAGLNSTEAQGQIASMTVAGQAKVDEIKLAIADIGDVEGQKNKATEMWAQYENQTQAAINKTKTFGESIKTTFKGIGKAALNIGTNMLAAFAIEGAIKLADKYIVNWQKNTIQATENMRDSWKELDQAEQTAKNTVDNYGQRYMDLNANESSLNTDELAEYNKIRNEIAASFPSLISGWDSEGNAILKATTNLQSMNEQLKIQQEQNRAQKNREFINEGWAGEREALFSKGGLFRESGMYTKLEQAKSDLNDFNSYLNGENTDFSKFVNSVQFKQTDYDSRLPSLLGQGYLKTINQWDEFGFDSDTVIKMLSGTLDTEQIENVRQEYIPVLTSYISEQSKLVASEITTLQEDAARLITSEFDNGGMMSGYGEELLNTILSSIGSFGADFFQQFETGQDLKKWLSFDFLGVFQRSINGVNTADELSAMQKAYKSYAGNMGNYADLRTAIETSKDELLKVLPDDTKWVNFVNQLTEGFLTDQDTSKLAHAAKVLQISQKEAENLSVKELDFLNTISSDQTLKRENLPALMSAKVEEDAKALENIQDKLKQAQTYETDLNALVDSFMEKGTLDLEKYNTLDKTGKDVFKVDEFGRMYVDMQQKKIAIDNQYAANAKSRAAAIQDAEIALAKARAAFTSEGSDANKKAVQEAEDVVNSLYAIEEAILRAADAWGTFSEAQKTPNAGDDWRDNKSALDYIKQAQKSERMNTDDYRNAMNDFFGEGSWENWSTKEQQKQQERAAKYYDKDGNITQKFFDNMIKAGNMSVSRGENGGNEYALTGKNLDDMVASMAGIKEVFSSGALLAMIKNASELGGFGSDWFVKDKDGKVLFDTSNFIGEEGTAPTVQLKAEADIASGQKAGEDLAKAAQEGAGSIKVGTEDKPPTVLSSLPETTGGEPLKELDNNIEESNKTILSPEPIIPENPDTVQESTVQLTATLEEPNVSQAVAEAQAVADTLSVAVPAKLTFDDIANDPELANAFGMGGFDSPYFQQLLKDRYGVENTAVATPDTFMTSLPKDTKQVVKIEPDTDEQSVTKAAEDLTSDVQNIVDDKPIEVTPETDPRSLKDTAKQIVNKVREKIDKDTTQDPLISAEGSDSQSVESKTVELDTNQAVQDAQALQDMIITPAYKTVDTNISQCIGEAQELNSLLAKPIIKTVTIATSGGVAAAAGTQNAKGGTTLVGEIAPEIIVNRRTGSWHLATYPQLTGLNRGDIVFNGRDTKKILAGKNDVRFAGSSFAGGTPKKGKSFAGAFKTYSSSVMKYTAQQMTKSNASSVATLGNTILGNMSSGGSSSKSSNTGGGGGGGGGSNGGSGRSSGSDRNPILDALDDLYDWIEKALEVAKKATDKLIKEAAKKIGFIAKNKAFDEALKSNADQITLNQQAYDKYVAQATDVQNQLGLSADIVNKVQKGAIDIETYDDEMQDKIKAYQKWWELAEECLETIDELKDQEKELNLNKLDSIVDYYGLKVDRLDARASLSDTKLDYKSTFGLEVTADDYQDALQATEEKVMALIDARKAYDAQFNALLTSGMLVADSDEWHEYISKLEEFDQEIVQSQVDAEGLKDAIAQIDITNLEYALRVLTDAQEELENILSFHDSQGTANVDSYYIGLIKNGQMQINNLLEQNHALLEQQEGMDILSEKYQEIQDQIVSNEQSIWEAKAAQEEWNDSIADLRIQELEKERDELEKTNDTYQRKKDLQDAIEDLEKAKSQRNKLIYRAGIGYVYEADQDAIRSAQDKVDQLRHQETIAKIDEAIDAIEAAKETDNVYDYEGTNVVKKFSKGGVNTETGLAQMDGTQTKSEVVFNSTDAAKLYNLVHDTADLEGMVTKGILNQTKNMLGGLEGQNVSISIGDINVYGVQDTNGLADSIIKNLPNALLQKLHGR